MDHPMIEVCPQCFTACPVTLRPDTPHWGSYRCPQHGLRWIPKPSNAGKRRKVNPNVVGKLPANMQDFCWCCRRDQAQLAALQPPIGMEIHHIIPVAEGGTDALENLQLLCAECHTDTHRRRDAFSRYAAGR